MCPESRVRNGQDPGIPYLRIKRIQKLYTTNLTSRHAGAMERSCSYNAKTGKETDRYGRFGLEQYLAAEEEDPGEAGGGDAAPDDDRRGKQRPVAVDHLRFSLPI